MFTPQERHRVRSILLEAAGADGRITGAAITGSAATGDEDRWSDIDLAFGVGEASALKGVLSDWTTRMYNDHRALHHLDINFAPWVYRVFLLPGTLQVDLAFAPADEFRALTPAFRLMHGRASEARYLTAPPADHVVGMAWLYAVHARTCIARRKLWQAEYMVSGIRDNVLALACLRHGVSTVHGRGMDLLPTEVTAPLEGGLVRNLDVPELSRALTIVIQELLREIEAVNPQLAERLQPELEIL